MGAEIVCAYTVVTFKMKTSYHVTKMPSMATDLPAIGLV